MPWSWRVDFAVESCRLCLQLDERRVDLMMLILRGSVMGGLISFLSSGSRHTSYIGDWSSDVCSSDLVNIVVGDGFSVDDVDTADNGDLSEGGLGIAIIRELADEVEIGPGDAGGSRLRFVKFLQG